MARHMVWLFSAQLGHGFNLRRIARNLLFSIPDYNVQKSLTVQG